jgi:hypothetical protein
MVLSGVERRLLIKNRTRVASNESIQDSPGVWARTEAMFDYREAVQSVKLANSRATCKDR